LEHAHTHNVLVAALKNGCFSALDLTSHTLTAFHVPIRTTEKRACSYFAVSRTKPFIFYVRDKSLAVSGIELFADSKNRVEYAHKKQVSCITVHPKKSVMASASIDGNIRIWDTVSHQLLVSFDEFGTDKMQRSAVTSLSFFSSYGASKNNNQNDLLVTGTRSGKVQVWYITPNEAPRVIASMKINEWVVTTFFHATLPCLMVLNHKGCLKAISIGHLITNFNSGTGPSMKGILTKFEMVDAFYVPLHDTSYATTQKNLRSLVPAISAKINDNSGLLVFFGKNYQVSNLNTPNVHGVIVSEYFPVFNTVDQSEFPASTLPICTTFPFSLDMVLDNKKTSDSSDTNGPFSDETIFELPISELLYLDTFTATPHDILMKYNIATDSAQKLQLIKTSPSLAEFHRCIQMKSNKSQTKLLIFYQKQAQQSSYNTANRTRLFHYLDLSKKAEIPPLESGLDGDFFEADNDSNREYFILEEDGMNMKIYEFGDSGAISTIKLSTRVNRVFSCPFKKDVILYYIKSHSMLAFAQSDLTIDVNRCHNKFYLRQNEVPISIQWQKGYPNHNNYLIGLLTTHRVLILDEQLQIRASVESPLQTRKSLYFQSCLWVGSVLFYNTCSTVYCLCPNMFTESPGSYTNFALCTLEHSNSVLSGVLFDRIFFTCYRGNCPQMSVRYVNIVEPLILSIIALNNETKESKLKWLQSVVSKFDCRSVSERTLFALERSGFADLASELITHSVYDFSWELRFRLALHSLQFAYAYEILLAQYQRGVLQDQVESNQSPMSPRFDSKRNFKFERERMFFMDEEYCSTTSPYYNYFVELAEMSLEHAKYPIAAKCYDIVNDPWSLFRLFSMFCVRPAVVPLARLAMRCKNSPDLYSIYMACRVVLGDAYNEQEEEELQAAILYYMGKMRLSLNLNTLDNMEWRTLPQPSAPQPSTTITKRHYDLGTSFKAQMKIKQEKKQEMENPLPNLSVPSDSVEPIPLSNFIKWMGYTSAEAKKSENDWDKIDFTGEFGKGSGRRLSQTMSQDDDSSADTISVQPHNKKAIPKQGSRPSLPSLDLPSTGRVPPLSFHTTTTGQSTTDDPALETERDADDETDMMSESTATNAQVDEEGFVVRPDLDSVRKVYMGGSSSDENNSSGSDGEVDSYKKKRKLFRKLRIKDKSEAVPAAKVDISSFAISGPRASVSLSSSSSGSSTARSKRRSRAPIRATEIVANEPQQNSSDDTTSNTTSGDSSPQINVNNQPVAPSTTTTHINPSESLKNGMALMEQGKYREAKNCVNEAISALVNDSTEVLKKTNLLLCVRYKLVILMLANNQRLEAKPGPTQIRDLARNSFLLSQVKVVAKHQVICRNMARKRNLQANNFGCTAIVTRQLLPLTPPQHRPEVEKCLNHCQEQSFSNEDKDLEAELLWAEQQMKQRGEDPEFLPMRFCWRTFDLFKQDVHEYLECPYCTAMYAPNEEAKIQPEKICSYCSYGTLEMQSK
jgi:WD40 repeat protein